MISKTQAEAIMSQMQLYVMHEETDKPVSCNVFCLHPDRMKTIGISDEELTTHDWYGGRDVTGKGEHVHIIYRNELEQFIQTPQPLVHVQEMMGKLKGWEK